MAEERRQNETGPAPPASSGERPESVGEYLATQRRLRGISLDELCERTKIPRRNLERLEAGAFDTQPDGFARGFVRTVALDLGLDADEAVMRLVGEPSPDELAPGSLALGWLVRVAAVAALVVAGLLVWRLALWAGQPEAGDPAGDSAPVTYRRDVVRSLAADAPPPQTSAAAAEAPAAEAAPAAKKAGAPPAEAAPEGPAGAADAAAAE